MSSGNKTRKNTLTSSDDASGRVLFDDRGLAVWETWRGKCLEHPGLSVMDDEQPTAAGVAPINAKGGLAGYDPYQSAILKKPPEQKPRKKDLRALSKWIQLQKKLKP